MINTKGYISLFNSNSNNYTVLFSTSRGGESAGTVAYNSGNNSSVKGGESAGTLAGSFSGGSSSGSCGGSCGSFTAIA